LPQSQSALFRTVDSEPPIPDVVSFTPHWERYEVLSAPWQVLFLILDGWINHREQDVLEYLLTDNRVLREKSGEKRRLLNEDQRRRLAVKGALHS
jgi:hypothetical protein